MTPAHQTKSTKTSSKTKTLATNRFQDYIALTKPGIIRGNLLSATAAFFLASQGHIEWSNLLAMLLGTSLIIASACVCNNVYDRNLDKSMERTQDRALAQGRVQVRSALLYALALGGSGLIALLLGTNIETAIVGVVGFVAYVWVYGYAKRHSVYGTHIGGISGATPPVAGYVAVTGQFDTTAAILFAIMMLWQMPHFFSIALYRKSDYAAAHIPVMPVRESARTAKLRIIGYIVAYGLVSLLLTIHGDTGITYLIVMTGMIAAWLWIGCFKLRGSSAREWGKRMFLFSLLVLLVQSLLIGINWLLP